jgi:hypothetical protein
MNDTIMIIAIAIGAIFLYLLIVSIRLNGHSDRLDRLESKADDTLPEYKPVVIVRNPEAGYTNVPTIQHDAEEIHENNPDNWNIGTSK